MNANYCRNHVRIGAISFLVMISMVIVRGNTSDPVEEKGYVWNLTVQASPHFHFIYDPNTRLIKVKGKTDELVFDNQFAATPALVGNFIFIYDLKSHPDQEPLKLINLKSNEKFAGEFPVNVRDSFPHPTSGFYRIDDNWAIQGFARFDNELNEWTHEYYLIIPADNGLKFARLFQHGERGFWAYMADGRLAFRSLNTDELIMVMVPSDQDFQELVIPVGSW